MRSCGLSFDREPSPAGRISPMRQSAPSGFNPGRGARLLATLPLTPRIGGGVCGLLESPESTPLEAMQPPVSHGCSGVATCGGDGVTLHGITRSCLVSRGP